MRITLTQSARVNVPAGTTVEMADSMALLLIRVGKAKKAESLIVEKAVKAPAETAEKKPAAKKRKTTKTKE